MLCLPEKAGVPAKMSTRENAHLSILRPRTLIRRQNSPVRRSRENVHQPRIWTPNSLHFAHAVHFAHGGQNLLLSFDCKSDWFWGFCTHTHSFQIKVCLGTKLVSLLTRLFHLVLSSNFRLSKEMHIISPSNIAVHVHCTQVTLVPFTKLLQIPVFYSCFILHSILPSIPCLTTKRKNKTKTSITSWQKEKEIKKKMKRHSE